MIPKMYRRKGEGRTHAQKMSWLRAFVAEVITALPWLTLGFVIGAVIEAAAAALGAL